MAEFARGFRLTLPDGTEYDGAQFPNGFVATSVRDEGLHTIATSMGNLLDAYPPGPVHILWAPETEEP
jgi:hypothetical protein